MVVIHIVISLEQAGTFFLLFESDLHLRTALIELYL